jgi:MATE family multidrug resistance protein
MILSVGFYWLVGLPVGYLLGIRFGWGAAGVWTGLCVALILIGSTLLYTWYRKEKTFSALGELSALNSQ